MWTPKKTNTRPDRRLCDFAPMSHFTLAREGRQNMLTLSDRFVLAILLPGLLVFGLLFFGAGRSSANPGTNGIFSRAANSTIIEQPLRVVSEESQTIEIVERATNAVVSIAASGEVPRMERCKGLFPDERELPPEWRDLFDFRAPGFCQDGTEWQRISAGTGFLVSPDGYILTNKHVVEDEGAEYTVILNERDRFGEKKVATVVARDPNTDVAVLKIDGGNYPFLTLADSSHIQVGQTAIAIGYALGEFDNTVSKGVVSGLSRSIEAQSLEGMESMRGLIQIDAAINPGNSGGPLLDIAGNVIGMNTAIAYAQNIGFAIPSNDIATAYEEAKRTGAITERERAYLGVRYIPITREIQVNNQLSHDYGMWIQRGELETDEPAVAPDSPAAQAGLQEHDIILAVNGKRLDEKFVLTDALNPYAPGDTIELKIVREGQEQTLDVTLGAQP
jgi:serine protease Do